MTCIPPMTLAATVAAASVFSLTGCRTMNQRPASIEPAKQITDAIQRDYWDAEEQAYLDVIPRRSEGLPYAMMWANGIQFTVLSAAAQHQPDVYTAPMETFLEGLERFWNPRVNQYSAYFGGTDDVYYDDNQWMILAYIEAYEVTQDAAYIDKAQVVAEGCLAGIDDVTGGGSYWHVDTKKYPTKNTCSNAPLATALLRLQRHCPEETDRRRYLEHAREILVWARNTLQDDRGLMLDNINTETGKITPWTFTYNTGLMIQGWLELYRDTQDPEHLHEAVTLAKASTHWLRPHGSGASERHYDDAVFFVVHLVEALMQLHEIAPDPDLLAACRQTADFYAHAWRPGSPSKLLDVAAIARLQWVMARYATPQPDPRKPAEGLVCSVRIELPGNDKILALAEVEVMSGGINVAPRGRALQSTVFEEAYAARAVDGSTNGDYQAGSVSHTGEGKSSPWWELQLAEPCAVDAIRVWNRTDACEDRLTGAQVLLLDGRRRVISSQSIEGTPQPDCLLQMTSAEAQ